MASIRPTWRRVMPRWRSTPNSRRRASTSAPNAEDSPTSPMSIEANSSAYVTANVRSKAASESVRISPGCAISSRSPPGSDRTSASRSRGDVRPVREPQGGVRHGAIAGDRDEVVAVDLHRALRTTVVAPHAGDEERDVAAGERQRHALARREAVEVDHRLVDPHARRPVRRARRSPGRPAAAGSPPPPRATAARGRRRAAAPDRAGSGPRAGTRRARTPGSAAMRACSAGASTPASETGARR